MQGSRAGSIVTFMKNPLSTAIIVAALAFLVPNNGAEAEGAFAATPLPASVLTTSSFMEASAPYMAVGEQRKEPDPTIAWLMAAGFLGLVVTRRIRGQ